MRMAVGDAKDANLAELGDGTSNMKYNPLQVGKSVQFFIRAENGFRRCTTMG